MNLSLSLVLSREQEAAFRARVDFLTEKERERLQQEIETLKAQSEERLRDECRSLLMEMLQGTTSPTNTLLTPVAQVPSVDLPGPVDLSGIPRHTTRELAKLLGCDHSSISNYYKAGLLDKLEGTGTSPTNPSVYLVPDLPGLKKRIFERQEAGKGKMGWRGAPTLKENDVEPGPIPTESVPAPTKSIPIPAPTKTQPPVPSFDVAEEARILAVDEAKSFYRPERGFQLVRLVHPDRYEWRTLGKSQAPAEGEIYQVWTLNGLNQWESYNNIPGAVGPGTSTIHRPLYGRAVG